MSGQGQLGLEGMPDRLVKVSPARLATWDDCRRRFRLVHLERPPLPRGPATASATLGAVVHNALRALFLLPRDRRTGDRAAALVDRHWSAEGFRDRAQAQEHRARAREWVRDYVVEHVERAGADAPEPVGLERWVSAPVGAIVAEGRVDRLDDRRGELVVVDYKTGRGAPDADDARRSPALALYALAVRGTLRRPCRRVELHHLPSGTVAAAEHDDASLAEHRRRAETSALALDAARDAFAAGGDPEEIFPPNPGPRCARCEVRRHCPEGRAAAPALEPWAGLAELAS